MTLAKRCYAYMFHNCTSLTTSPELAAKTLVESCYVAMFWYCSKLEKITMLATDINAYDCLSSWTREVSSSGIFIKAAEMKSLSNRGESGIPPGWTVIDY